MDEPIIDVQAINADDLAPWLEGKRTVGEFRERYPEFASDQAATDSLDGVREGLADIAAGRVFTTEEMMRRLEARRLARRAAA